MMLTAHQGYVPQELYTARIERVRRENDCYWILDLNDGSVERVPLDPYAEPRPERPRPGQWYVVHPLSTRGYPHATAQYGLTVFTIEPKHWKPRPLKEPVR